MSDGRKAARVALAVQARAAWPTIDLDDTQFYAHVERHYHAQPIEGVHAADLWLAFACAAGHALALHQLEARLRPILDQVSARMRISGDRAGEVGQLVRARLLVGAPDRPPRIAGYSGRGELTGWLRAAATRVALNFLHGEPRETGDDELVERLPAAGDDPELRLLKSRYAEPFSRAFREALASLPSRDRLLLKEHYLDGLSTEAMGALHRVHRVTVARWLDAARTQVAAEAERRLGELLRLPKSELESLMRVVRSRIDLSLHDFLAEAP